MRGICFRDFTRSLNQKRTANGCPFLILFRGCERVFDLLHVRADVEIRLQ